MNESLMNTRTTTGTGVFFTLLMVANSVSSATRTLIPPMLTTLRGAFPTLASDEPFGLLLSIATLLMGVSTLLWGILADRHSKRILLAVTTLGWGAVNLLAGIPPISFELFVIYQILNAFLIGAIIPVGLAITAEMYPTKSYGLRFGWFTTGTNLGFGLGYVLGGFVPTTGWWNLPYFGIGMVGIGLGIVFSGTSIPKNQDKWPTGKEISDRGQANPAPSSETGQIAPALRVSRADVKNILGDRANRLIILIALFGVIPTSAFGGWFIRFLTVDHGIVEDSGTLVLFLLFASQLAGMVVLGAIADKREAKRPNGRLSILSWVTILGTIGTIWAIAVPFWMTTPDLFVYFANANFSTFFVLLFVGTFLTSVIGPLTMVIIVNNAPKHLQASTIAINFLFITVGSSVGILLCSTLATAFFAGTYTWSFVIINLFYVPSIFCILKLLKQNGNRR